MDTFFRNTLNNVIKQVGHGANWLYKQDYKGMLARIDMENMWIYFTVFAMLGLYCYITFMAYLVNLQTPRPNKRKFEPEDPIMEQNRNIKRRLSLQAEKYRHASAFQTIQTQVGEDPRSWPVILLNEVILLREDLARLQKKNE
jgi:hypothetical protein